MVIVGIDSHPSGSTKRIMDNILDKAEENGYETYSFSGNWKTSQKSKSNRIIFGYEIENKVSGFFAKLTGLHGYFSILGTISLIRKLNHIKPDIIHLHNLHLWTINIPILIRYINRNRIPVVWTLHDCWGLTGHCTHFIQSNCDKWMDGCYSCKNRHTYPFSYLDSTKMMWNKKRKWFTSIMALTIVVPSVWLKCVVEKSYLAAKKCIVINNGVNQSIFRRDSKEGYESINIDGKYVILGVAYSWSQKKGLDEFVRLANELDENYQIILVGTTEEIDKQLPKRITSIHRTENIYQMAELYHKANVFANPTREDNFPTTIMESISCGTPVVTYDVGGCREILDEKTGIVVPVNDYHLFKESIINICNAPKSTYIDACVQRAERYNENVKYQEYINLYNQILQERT